MLYELITINTRHGNDEALGCLSVFEPGKDINFDIKRVYYISGTKEGIRRGHHAHKTLWQLLFCPCGSIRVNVDNGREKDDVLLDSPSKALIVGPGVWHTMDWMESDSVLCVAASDRYDESDYLRDYTEFLEYMKNHPELI